MMSGVNQNWPNYIPQEIEPKWQLTWENSGLHKATETGNKPKYYCLDFFPYPSGEGLHVGHCRNYVPTDVISRFYRMNGWNVLHPMGWDAFGEPSEQFAIAHNVHPRITTDRNTANFRRQMKMIGTSYDWSREIDSSRPEFYRWTQWFFLMLYRRGLAYRDTNWQWWCPVCQTTLSSHEVSGGVCWRGHTGVIKKEIPAWYFRITDYADELLNDLDRIDWPEPIKLMQRNWIGRSEGCLVNFKTDSDETIQIFTTRPDTLFGVTFFVLAPEHQSIERLTSDEQRAEVTEYIQQSSTKSEVERMQEARENCGVFTGGYVINPSNDERLPVWVADYVLPTYGTGAVMGVPAHDQRDYAFAKKFDLPIRVVITPPGEDHNFAESAYTGYGNLVNSGRYDGMPSEEAIQAISKSLAEQGSGGDSVQYRMCDWLISRQRYWGTPIPIIYCQACGLVPVPEDQLPVLLPDITDFRPDGSGRSPLARLPEFVTTTCPQCGGAAERETDTMGGFACSSWYFLRFTSPEYDLGPFEPEAMRYWMPVDLYVGGAEHAVLHLLYARFWVKVMADEGLVPFREPFTRLVNQGQLMGTDGMRMSKSRGNVITPDSVAETYGADALRIYGMFMAPFEYDVNWSTEGINGSWRFLNRLWNLYEATYIGCSESVEHDPELERELHKTVQKVTERIMGFSFNTMVSALMEFFNLLADRHRTDTWRTRSFTQALRTFLILIAPSAPHIAEELWHLTGNKDSIHAQAWPDWDPELVKDELVTVPVQIDGKVRDTIEVRPDANERDIQLSVLNMPKIRQHLAEKNVKKIIYIPGKIINIVTFETIS
ncbi:MAG TPA: leucine--tRNA ligase [Anaerolineales bacterium]|nr:leucine--tRNA ligase [Anaerolineales bacterium]